MELGSFFLILAVLIIAGMYLYAPFIERTKQVEIREDHEISALKAERDRIINSLQELDFDFKLGKIPAEDYPQQRASLLQKGADVLRQLDDFDSDLTPNPLVSPKGAPDRRGEEARIEKAAADGSDSQMSNDEIEALISARRLRQQKKNKSAGFCTRCGKPVLVTDKFCPSCGKALA
jgi:rubrerythrin